MNINQTNIHNSKFDNADTSLPSCLNLVFPDPLKNSCIIASLHGFKDSINVEDIKAWENCAAFTVNGYPAFMMRGYRSYISVVIVDGEAIFISDVQFWSEYAVFNCTSDLPSPNECLMAFYLNIEMMTEKESPQGTEQAIERIFNLLQISRFDGFLPKPELAHITPKIKQLVLNKFMDSQLMFAEHDFHLEYAGCFMEGSINDHTFEITHTFNGLAFSFDVNITSDYHLNLSVESGNLFKINFHGPFIHGYMAREA